MPARRLELNCEIFSSKTFKLPKIVALFFIVLYILVANVVKISAQLAAVYHVEVFVQSIQSIRMIFWSKSR